MDDIDHIDRRRKEREQSFDEGLHLLNEGVRLFHKEHSTLDADEKERRISELEKLHADLVELRQELDKKVPLLDLSVLLGIKPGDTVN